MMRMSAPQFGMCVALLSNIAMYHDSVSRNGFWWYVPYFLRKAAATVKGQKLGVLLGGAGAWSSRRLGG